ncbi:MAG: hypothetical protein ACTHJR_18135, partial [Sphingomonas sp.]|uniref:hypothetical protein n=1 Tax=Sphingomonas sp. TaxID=28214 RepID=UPI003F7DB3AB
ALQYFKPLPIVHNGTIDPPKYTYQGDNWSLRPESGSLGVIMGGVRYPVTTNNLDWGIRSDKDISPLLEYGIDLFLPIGAVGVALSREQLSYNEKTNKVLKEALKSIIEDVTATFATMFDSEPTVWEAQRKLGEEIGTGYQPREKLLAGHAKYKGQPLSQFYSFPERVVSQLGQHPFPASLWYIPDISDYRRKTTRVTKVDWKTPRELGSVRPSNIAQIVVDDLPDENKSRAVAKIKVFVEGTSQDKATLVLRANERTDKKAIAALLAKMGSPANVVYTSTLPEPPKHASARNTNRPRVRMFGYDGAKIQQGWHKVHPDSLVPSDNKRGHVWEIDYADQPDGGVIVVMSQFRLPNNFYYYMNSGLFEYTELHFVNEGDWKKLDTTKWTKFEDEFNKRINDKLAAIPELGERLAIDAALGNRDDLRKVSETGRLSAKELARPYGKLVTLWETYVKPLDEEQKRLTPYVTVKLPTGVDPKKIIEQFNDKQPDARILLNVLNLDQDSHLDLFIRNLEGAYHGCC